MARRRKKGWQGVLSGALALLLLAGAVVGIVSYTDRDTRSIGGLSFSVGALNASGAFQEYDQAIVSDYFECQGLTVEPASTANGSFEVFYYDEHKTFLGSSGVLSPVDGVYIKPSGHLDSYVFLLAKYARIVISPDAPVSEEYEDETFRIRFWETPKYAATLSITVDKGQVFERAEKNRLFDDSEGIQGYWWVNALTISDGTSVAKDWTASPVIEIPDGTTVVEVWYRLDDLDDNLYLSPAGADGVFTGYKAVLAEEHELGGVYYHTLLYVKDHKYLVAYYGGSPEVFMYAFKN